MRKEIDDWFEQAKADLKSSTDLLKTENFYASVFFSQQTTENGKGGASMGRNDASDEIEKFLKMVKEIIRVEKVIVFGSRARGDYLVDSDVDLIMVSRDFEGVPFYERMDKLILLWESPLDLDVLCYTPEEFKMKQEEICIVKQAVEEGVVIAG